MNATFFDMIARSLQVHFPGLQDYRFALQRTVRRLRNRTHEEEFDFLPFLPRKESNLCVDVGSNRGDAILSILMRKPGARVIGFEPNPYVTERLNRLFRTHPQVEIVSCGLGYEKGSFELAIPFYNNYMFDGLASFREEVARTWLRGRILWFKPQKLQIRKTICPVKRLDDFSLNPFFIKIDVQGFEFDVLQGSKETLMRSRPVLLIETPQKKETRFLSDLGYRSLHLAKGRLLEGNGGKALNTFFIAEEDYPLTP